MNYKLSLIACAVLGTAILGGCASKPARPTESMARAQASYEQADQGGARRYDAATLDMARSKLTQAQAAVDKGDMKQADWLAQQAEVDAELAGARARSATAQKAVSELRASIATLREETQRPTMAPTTTN